MAHMLHPELDYMYNKQTNDAKQVLDGSNQFTLRTGQETANQGDEGRGEGGKRVRGGGTHSSRWGA
jgi:hypothetical protein